MYANDEHANFSLSLFRNLSQTRWAPLRQINKLFGIGRGEWVKPKNSFLYLQAIRTEKIAKKVENAEQSNSAGMFEHTEKAASSSNIGEV